MLQKNVSAKIRFCFKKSIKQQNISIFGTYEIFKNSVFISLEDVVLHSFIDDNFGNDSIFATPYFR
jgi:hypothetical protein